MTSGELGEGSIACGWTRTREDGCSGDGDVRMIRCDDVRSVDGRRVTRPALVSLASRAGEAREGMDELTLPR